MGTGQAQGWAERWAGTGAGRPVSRDKGARRVGTGRHTDGQADDHKSREESNRQHLLSLVTNILSFKQFIRIKTGSKSLFVT